MIWKMYYLDKLLNRRFKVNHMKYYITINNQIKEQYSSLEEAEFKLQKHIEKIEKQQAKIKSNVKFKKPKVKIVQIPEICVGLKIYNTEDKFIGEIVDESDNLWFTRKSDNEEITTPWLKENFQQKYVDGLFVVGDDK